MFQELADEPVGVAQRPVAQLLARVLGRELALDIGTHEIRGLDQHHGVLVAPRVVERRDHDAVVVPHAERRGRIVLEQRAIDLAPGHLAHPRHQRTHGRAAVRGVEPLRRAGIAAVTVGDDRARHAGAVERVAERTDLRVPALGRVDLGDAGDRQVHEPTRGGHPGTGRERAAGGVGPELLVGAEALPDRHPVGRGRRARADGHVAVAERGRGHDPVGGERPDRRAREQAMQVRGVDPLEVTPLHRRERDDEHAMDASRPWPAAAAATGATTSSTRATAPACSARFTARWPT